MGKAKHEKARQKAAARREKHLQAYRHCEQRATQENTDPTASPTSEKPMFAAPPPIAGLFSPFNAVAARRNGE